MNKKGFTLIELLAVIALLGIIIVIAVPNITSIFFKNKNTLSDIQKDQLKNAVEMYISDYCTEPISNNTCSFTTDTNSVTGIIYVKSGSMSLNDFSETGYLDNSIKNNCSGTISINNGVIDLSNITCDF